MGSSVGKLLGSLAGPIAAFSGVGLPLSAAIGAGGGLLSGGGLKGALGGALGGASLAGGGGLLGNALGLGSGSLGNAIGGGLLSAAGGGLSGGLKGALLGAATGGLGGYFGNGGTEELFGGDTFGHIAGSPLAGGVGPTQGSGILGGLTDGSIGKGLGLVSGGGAGASSGSYLSPLLSAGLGTYSNDESKKALLEQQQANQNLLSPFVNSKFEPGDLTQDPGYQFQLGQGNQALDRQQSAKGNYFSGEALKSAQDYGQGLAGTTYNQAFNRYLQQQGQNLGAAGALAGVNTNIGNINSGAITNENNLLSGAGASLLGGNGFSNTGSLLGQNDLLSQLLKLKQQQGVS